MRLVQVVLALLLFGADSRDDDENERVLGRGKKVFGAASFLHMDLKRHTIEEQHCAACEAVAQSIERQMSLDHHKSGRGPAVEMLMSACDGIETRTFVQEFEAMPEAGWKELMWSLSLDSERVEGGGGIGDAHGKVLMFHTFRPEELKVLEQQPELKAQIKGRGSQSAGLEEYCSAFVEEFESRLVATMLDAKPLDESQVQPEYALESSARRHYEVTDQICVTVTKSCNATQLYSIFAARQNNRAQEEAQSMGTKMGSKGKGKGKTKDKGRGKAGKTKSAQTPAERGWQPADAVEWAQRAPLTAFEASPPSPQPPR